jgi:hypothetical protein
LSWPLANCGIGEVHVEVIPALSCRSLFNVPGSSFDVVWWLQQATPTVREPPSGGFRRDRDWRNIFGREIPEIGIKREIKEVKEIPHEQRERNRYITEHAEWLCIWSIFFSIAFSRLPISSRAVPAVPNGEGNATREPVRVELLPLSDGRDTRT